MAAEFIHFNLSSKMYSLTIFISVTRGQGSSQNSMYCSSNQSHFYLNEPYLSYESA